MVIYNDGHTRIKVLDNGDVEIQSYSPKGVYNIIDEVIIPNRIARYIDFDDLANLDMIKKE